MNRSRYILFFTVLPWLYLSCSSPYPVDSSSQNTNNHPSEQNKEINGSSSMFPIPASTDGGVGTAKGSTQPPSTNDPGEETRTLPPEVTTAIIESKIPIYEGNSPPKIEGYYHCVGHIVASLAGRPPGAAINSYFEYLNQQTNHSIAFEEFTSRYRGRGWIVGRNNTFTVYASVYNEYLDCRVVSVISGTQHGGELREQHLVVYPPSQCPNHRIWGHSTTVWEQQSLVLKLVEKPKDTSPPPTKEEEPPKNEDPNRTPPPPPPPPPPGPFP